MLTKKKWISYTWNKNPGNYWVWWRRWGWSEWRVPWWVLERYKWGIRKRRWKWEERIKKGKYWEEVNLHDWWSWLKIRRWRIGKCSTWRLGNGRRDIWGRILKDEV